MLPGPKNLSIPPFIVGDKIKGTICLWIIKLTSGRRHAKNNGTIMASSRGKHGNGTEGSLSNIQSIFLPQISLRPKIDIILRAPKQPKWSLNSNHNQVRTPLKSTKLYKYLHQLKREEH